jgi:hypothetical protein
VGDKTYLLNYRDSDKEWTCLSSIGDSVTNVINPICCCLTQGANASKSLVKPLTFPKSHLKMPKVILKMQVTVKVAVFAMAQDLAWLHIESLLLKCPRSQGNHSSGEAITFSKLQSQSARGHPKNAGDSKSCCTCLGSRLGMTTNRTFAVEIPKEPR